jgi:hypothetical protein
MSNLSINDLNALQNSLDYWNWYFINNGMQPPLQWQGSNQYGPPNILIYVDPNLHGSTDVAVFTHANNDITNPNGSLALNPDYVNRGNVDLITTVGAHEFGHSLGLPDNFDTACRGNTAMYGYISPSSGPFLGTRTTDCDREAELRTWKPPSDGWPPPPPGSQGSCNTCPVNGPGTCNDASCMGQWEPLALDLNGDGVNTTGPDRMVWFDLDGDGTKDHITWTNGTTMEGLLWVNLTGKNRVDNGSELFGIGTVLPDGTKARDGFQALAMYDDPARGGNSDGVIDTSDAVWNKLRLWVDKNHNAICEPNEVNPIHKYGVERISLSATRTTFVDAQGNGHYLRSHYWRHVGGQLQVYDIDGLTFQGDRH